MEKFTRTNAERYIRNNNDAQVAQLGHLNALVDAVNNVSTTSNPLKLDLIPETLGQKVSFEKTNYGTEVDVIIPGQLEITRGNNGGIYNIAVEPSHTSGSSTLNTLWASKLKDNNFNDPLTEPDVKWNSTFQQGWALASNAKNFYYTDWANSLYIHDWGSVPETAVTQNLEMVLHHPISDRYWLIKFTKWTRSNGGGGFAYDRWEIYPKVEFVRPANQPLVVDTITPGQTVLKRDDSLDLLYNAAKESQSAYAPGSPPYEYPKSPIGTLWNSVIVDERGGYNGWSNLLTIKNRIYSNFWDANGSDNVDINLDFVMLDQATGFYYMVKFTNWSASGDGAVSYTRRLIPMTNSIEVGDSIITGGAGAIDYGVIANNVTYGYKYYKEVLFSSADILGLKAKPLKVLPQLTSNNPLQYYDFKVIFEFNPGSTPYIDATAVYELNYGSNVLAIYPTDTLKGDKVFSANSSVFVQPNSITNNVVSIPFTGVTFTVNAAGNGPTGGNGTLKAKIWYNIINKG